MKIFNNIFEIPQNAKIGIFGFGEFGKKIYNTLLFLRKDVQIVSIGDDKLAGNTVDTIMILNIQNFAKKAKEENLLVTIGAYGDLIVNTITTKLETCNITPYFIKDILRYEHNVIMASEKVWNGFFDTHGFSDDELSRYSKDIEISSAIFDKKNGDLYKSIIEFRRVENLKKVDHLFKNIHLVSQGEQYYENYDYENIETVIEGGMFDGYDIYKMLKLFPNLKKVYSFEPFLDYYDKFWGKSSIEESNKSEIIQKVLWDKSEKLRFVNGGCWSRPSSGDNTLEVESTSIDKFRESIDKKIDFIKLDVEGSEKNALLGAKKTIKNDRPILAVSIYHSKQDMIELPQLLNSLCENYHFKLGHYTYHFTETIVYGIPKERL